MFGFEDGHLVGDNGRLRIVFDGSTGGIRHLTNAVTGHVLLDTDAPIAWRLTPNGSTSELTLNSRPSFRFHTIEPTGFEAAVTGDRVELRWTTTDPGVLVEVDVRSSDLGEFEMWPRVLVDDGVEPPVDFTYPVLAGVEQLSELGAGDMLVFPAHSGWLIRRPLQQMFPISSPYPDGYSGCSMQFMAYIEQGAGGFYFATHDPHSTWKTFTFGGEASIKHDNWDLRAGTKMELDYPIVIAPLHRGDWFEASERYRRWVVESAPWFAGVAKRDSNGARWLRDEVGVSIWCTPSSLDWSRWYRFYAEELGQPMHIVPGWEWPATRPHTVGKEGWFPANFHPANVETWTGHYVTPYINDWFISPAAESFVEKWEPELVMPYRFFTFSVFSRPEAGQLQGTYPTTDPRIATDHPFYLCPSSEAQRDLHAWRDLGLVRDYGLDGSFYDISSGNPFMFSRCLRRDHDHPPGRGRHLIQALEGVNRASKDLVEQETGRYLAQGTETIIENIIGSIDFYVSRAAGGPMGFLETETQGPEEPPGTGRELIPLFQSVYHDIGPVHEDGWIRLIESEGELFYWIAARIYVQWGGLMSIHYPITPAEKPTDYEGTSEAIGWGGQHQVFSDLPELDRSKTAFIRALGQARTTFARPYLAYGRMARSAPLDAGTIELSFNQELPGMTTFRNAGAWAVPQVVHSAWIDDASGTLGLVYVNLDTDDTTIVLDLNVAETWGLHKAGHQIRRLTTEGAEQLGVVDDRGRLSTKVELPSRAVVLIEVA